MEWRVRGAPRMIPGDLGPGLRCFPGVVPLGGTRAGFTAPLHSSILGYHIYSRWILLTLINPVILGAANAMQGTPVPGCLPNKAVNGVNRRGRIPVWRLQQPGSHKGIGNLQNQYRRKGNAMDRERFGRQIRQGASLGVLGLSLVFCGSSGCCRKPIASAARPVKRRRWSDPCPCPGSGVGSRRGTFVREDGGRTGQGFEQCKDVLCRRHY